MKHHGMGHHKVQQSDAAGRFPFPEPTYSASASATILGSVALKNCALASAVSSSSSSASAVQNAEYGGKEEAFGVSGFAKQRVAPKKKQKTVQSLRRGDTLVAHRARRIAIS